MVHERPQVGAVSSRSAHHASSRFVASVLADRALVHPDRQQVPVCLPQHRAGPDPQDLTDLVAVELRPDGGQLLLGGQLLDPRLELVVAAGQPAGLARVAGRAVRAGQQVQPLEERPGVGHVAPDRRVRPLPLPVPVEAQVQLDQPGHRGDRLLVVAHRLEPLGHHPGADQLVVVERHPSPGLEAAGRRLADVVQQRGEAQHQVRPLAAAAALQRDRLFEHGQGVRRTRPCAGGARRPPAAARAARAGTRRPGPSRRAAATPPAASRPGSAW